MKVVKLEYDQSKCPNCKYRGVMYESDDGTNVERYCVKCNYKFKFKKEPMYY